MAKKVASEYNLDIEYYTFDVNRGLDALKGKIGKIKHIDGSMSSGTLDLFGGKGLLEAKKHTFLDLLLENHHRFLATGDMKLIYKAFFRKKMLLQFQISIPEN